MKRSAIRDLFEETLVTATVARKESAPRRDVFSSGYFRAAVFYDLPEEEDHTLPVFPACVGHNLVDCKDFQTKHRDLLKNAYLMGSDEGTYGPFEAGRDFWLSRQGHAVGFLSRGLKAIGEQLHQASKAYRDQYVLSGTAENGHKEYIFIE